MGTFINDCGKHVYIWIEGKWYDITDAMNRYAGVDDLDEEIDDDDIPFCDGNCAECPETDQLDDYEVVDEDEAELWEGDAMFWGIPDFRHIIFNDPATIVFWDDGTKTVVKCMEGEKFERYAGFAMACMKKMFGSTSRAKAIMNDFDLASLKPNKTTDKPKETKPKQKSVSLDQLIDAFTSAVKNVAESKDLDKKAEESKDETPAE